MSGDLERSTRDRCAIIALARPASRNAMTPAMLAAACSAVDDASADGRAVVLCGLGDVFSAGFDLKLCQRDVQAMPELLRLLSRLIAAMRAAPVPVVVAAHGAAVAGAAALLGAADHAVADVSAKIGYPVARLGLSPAVSAPFLATRVSDGRSRRLMLDPGLMSGAEAHAAGLVHECVAEPAAVLDAALSVAEALAGKPRAAFAATKAWVNDIDTRLRGHRVAPADPSTDWPARGLAVSLATSVDAETRRRLDALSFS